MIMINMIIIIIIITSSPTNGILSPIINVGSSAKKTEIRENVGGDVWSAPIEQSRPPRNDSFPSKPQQGVAVIAIHGR